MATETVGSVPFGHVWSGASSSILRSMNTAHPQAAPQFAFYTCRCVSASLQRRPSAGANRATRHGGRPCSRAGAARRPEGWPVTSASAERPEARSRQVFRIHAEIRQSGRQQEHRDHGEHERTLFVAEASWPPSRALSSCRCWWERNEATRCPTRLPRSRQISIAPWERCCSSCPSMTEERFPFM